MHLLFFLFSTFFLSKAPRGQKFRFLAAMHWTFHYNWVGNALLCFLLVICVLVVVVISGNWWACITYTTTDYTTINKPTYTQASIIANVSTWGIYSCFFVVVYLFYFFFNIWGIYVHNKKLGGNCLELD